jgi:peptidoglycan/xylan/chitin deacetylase (PgdA/CDA1 family)
MQKLSTIIILLLLHVALHGQVIRKPIPDKTIVLTFDDASISHITLVAPLLKKYKFGGTFFICEFPPDFEDNSKYMTWQEIKKLSKQGFEIGNHTKNHLRVDKIDEATLISELSYINSKCKLLNITRPLSFAYPSSYSDSSAARKLTEQGFLLARVGGSRAYDPEKDHPLYIPGFTIKGSDKELFYNAISQAKEGKVVVLTFHGVPDNAHDWVTTPPALFEEYLKYLYEQKYNVIAMKDLLPFLNLPLASQLPIPLYTKK